MYKPIPNPKVVPDPFRSPQYKARTENRENVDISQWRHKLTYCDAGAAYGARGAWRNKGTMSGGISSSLPIARAFIGTRG